MTNRILLVDDHNLWRNGLRSMIEAHALEVVAEASDGRDAVSLYLRCRPDLVIMDLSIPGISGLETTREILQLAPEAKILVVTMDSTRESVLEALRCGAQGYLAKTCTPTDLLNGIAAVLRGTRYVSPELASGLLDLSARVTKLPLPRGGRQTTSRARPKRAASKPASPSISLVGRAFTPAWLTRRREFVHDAFNPYLRALSSMLEESPRPQHGLDVAGDWQTIYGALLMLLNDFEAGMSPRIALAYPPLSHCDPTTRDWMAKVLHRCWLTQKSVRRQLHTAKAACRAADRAVNGYAKHLHNPSEGPADVMRKPLRNLISTLCSLRAALESFPSGVRVK